MTTQCECPIAGYCDRHNRIKNEHLHALCQTRQDYFDAWERTPKRQRQFALGPAYNHWMPLHYYAVKHWDDWNKKEARKWYSKWKLAIPKTGCGCAESWKTETATMPPKFVSAKAFFEWSVEIHNAVSLRLGKQLQSIEDARAIWFG